MSRACPCRAQRSEHGVSTRPAEATTPSPRDNRVHYMFAHTDELVAAGGVAMVFGTGAGGQSSLTSDNNQFRDAARAYYMNPRALP